MIRLDEVGAHPSRDGAGRWHVRFGIYLPGITFDKGYRLKLRLIHELDQFIHQIEPRDFDMFWDKGSDNDLWHFDVDLAQAAASADAVPGSHFGQPGRYLYRYQLLGADGHPVAFWFSDPYARETGLGTLSAFSIDDAAGDFAWTDAAYRTPEIDDMVVYELNVREFNGDFAGVVLQLDYIRSLGVNVLELMPVSNVKEIAEWGYTPLDYFAPDERLGGATGLKRLVDAAHAMGMAVVLDSVYAHTHPEFTYNLVYELSGEPNPMLGRFEGEFFADWAGTDYRKQFTRDYFLALNKYLLDEYHVDGFRYDYVPGMYDGPVGQGYADLVYNTYQYAKGIARFQAEGGRSRIVQCAEHLPDPIGILTQTHSNCAWDNGLLDVSRAAAHGQLDIEALAHRLDPNFIGYPSEHTAGGDVFPVAPFQYVESHDHPRFVNEFASLGFRDLLGQRYGNRALFYKVQPFVIALYTAKGIPMLWSGQEFAENWGMPDSGLGRNLFERPLHWEFFYDEMGKALVRLHRTMGALRNAHRALGSRGFFFYYADEAHRRQGVIAFRRRVDADGARPEEELIIAINFSDQEAEAWIAMPRAGRWVERIDGRLNAIDVATDGEWHALRVPSNYGVVYERA